MRCSLAAARHLGRAVALLTASAHLIGGCTSPPPAVPVAVLEVVARVGAPGEPGTWSARLAGETRPAPARGCAPVIAAPFPVTPIGGLRVTRPSPAALVLTEGGWATTGPRRVVDPAWTVGDVRLTVGEEELVAEGAVRFGGMPQGVRSDREPEGGVRLAWDAGSVDSVEVAVVGPAGEVRCGADAGVAALPWWAVPPEDGVVYLRSARVLDIALPDGSELRVRATIERAIPLDVSRVQAAEPPPPPAAAAPTRRTRRSSRPQRPFFG